MCWDLNWAGGRRVLLVVLAASLRLLNPIVAPPSPSRGCFRSGPLDAAGTAGSQLVFCALERAAIGNGP